MPRFACGCRSFWFSLFPAFDFVMQDGSFLCRRKIGTFNDIYKLSLYRHANLLLYSAFALMLNRDRRRPIAVRSERFICK